MKSIRTRFSLLLIALLTGVLLLCNIAVFTQIEHYFRNELERNQRLIAAGNRRGLEYFLSLVNQTGIAVVSDRLIGAALSEPAADRLVMLAARTEVNSQFYHLTSTVTGSDGYYYRSLLFLDGRLPLTPYFTPATLNVERGTINCVYSNELVKDEDWYLATLQKNRSLYVFLSEDQKTLCLARSILNLHFTGPSPNDGIGVMVTRVDISKLEEVFSFSQVTPGTAFYLLSPEDVVLFSSDPASVGRLYDEERTDPGDAIVYSDDVSWNMRLIFQTPYRDIDIAMRPISMSFLLTSLIVIAVAAAIGLLFSGAVTRPIIALSRTMKSITDTRLVKTDALRRKGEDEIAQLYGSFETMIVRTNALIDDVQHRTELQKQAEMKMMQAQINPHFLYNAMDSINWIALTNKQDEIADMVASLAALLRYSISHTDGPSTLGAELENIRHYTALQKVRYQERVSVAVSVEPALYGTKLPPITLQPLVENAIRHGLANAFCAVHIDIAARCEGEMVCVSVTDDGAGCPCDLLNAYLGGEEGKLCVHGGLGIRNVNERLALFCHSEKPLRYRNLPGGRLAAEIRVPR